ncbi:MAG: porin family protein [Bacteroidales bacterium]|nr:porin family protein [Bacteroidales bacterium]
MKKLMLIMVALFATTVMFGQFHIGPQIGFTSSKLTTNQNDIKTSFKSNFVFGAFARIGDKIYVQPEINWLTQGGVWEAKTDGSEIGKTELTYKTIQIPVSVGYKLIDMKVVNIRVFGGFAANIAADKKMKINDITEPIKDADWSNMVWQYQVGAGVDVLMFALDIKYMGGLNNLYKGDVQYDGETLSTKSNLFMVTLGWKIF